MFSRHRTAEAVCTANRLMAKSTGLASWVAAVCLCSPLAAHAATGPSEETALAEQPVLTAETGMPGTLSTIEIIAPSQDEALGVILYRFDGNGRPTRLRFGGPR